MKIAKFLVLAASISLGSNVLAQALSPVYGIEFREQLGLALTQITVWQASQLNEQDLTGLNQDVRKFDKLAARDAHVERVEQEGAIVYRLTLSQVTTFDCKMMRAAVEHDEMAKSIEIVSSAGVRETSCGDDDTVTLTVR